MTDLILAPVKPCIKCGACDRDKRGNCRPCIKACVSAWRSANRDKVKATASAWLAANTDKAKATFSAWYSLNLVRIRAQQAAWSAANKEKMRVYNAAREKANPAARKIYVQNRRARKKEAGGQLSKGLAQKLFKLQKGKCPCCALPLGDDYELDHKMPLALGGSNTDDNAQLLRAKCNRQKATKHPVDFMQSRGFLL